jgi:hypothetical protein
MSRITAVGVLWALCAVLAVLADYWLAAFPCAMLVLYETGLIKPRRGRGTLERWKERERNS